MQGIEFSNFAEEFGGHGLGGYQESLLPCKLGGGRLLCWCSWSLVDTRYNNFIEGPRLTDYKYFLVPQFIAIGGLKNVNVILCYIGENSDS
jgi:hypothetical protein